MKKMEVLKLSIFKLQLEAFVAEARALRESEASATQKIHLLVQKQKRTEEEYGRKFQELQTELDSCNKSREKLEKKVSYLEKDNDLVESTQADLRATVQTLLRSRDSFVSAYQESTCQTRNLIEARDKRIALLSEKITAHLSWFDSIEKEAFSVKQIVDNVHKVVSEKEDLVASLKSRMDQFSKAGKFLIGKINELDSKLKNSEDDLRKKDKIILGLEVELEAAKISNIHHMRIEELQKSLADKDKVIQNLVSEKEASQFDTCNLSYIMQRLQNAVTNINEEDRRTLSSILVQHQEDCDASNVGEDDRIQDVVENPAEEFSNEASVITDGASASPQCQKYIFKGSGSQEKANSTCLLPKDCSRQEQNHSFTEHLLGNKRKEC